MIRLTQIVAVAAAVALLGVAPGAHAQSKGKGAAPAGDPSTRSRAVTQEIVDAIAMEMERAATSLAVPGAPRPYFIAYKLTEVEVNDVAASMGFATAVKERHFVNLDAHVHVGDYQLDNSNYLIPQREHIDGVASIGLPIEATPRLARRATWLATDNAYKEALEQLTNKLARTRGTDPTGKVPSYTKAKPVVSEEPVLVPALEGTDELRARAEALSAVLREYDYLRDSRVAFTSFLERRWYINTEGTSTHDTRRVTGVIITASTQADDGEELALHFSHYGHTAADLPGDDRLVAEAHSIARTLAALRAAPLVDNYTGPVLFEGVGATGIVRHTLAPHMSGTPLPENLPPDAARRFGGALTDRIGLRVLSNVLSVVDDPTATHAGKAALIGGYRFDDEGVPAQRVQVIRDGTLATLLMSRTPSRHLGESNGHARRFAPGGVFHGSATNLFVSGRRGLARPALVRALLAEVRAQGLPHGIIIRMLDDAAVTAGPERSNHELLHLFQTTDQDQPPPAVLAYRVYPDGREELVRGVQLRPVPMTAWRDVMAIGRESTVYNYLASGQSNLDHQVSGTEDGFVPSAGVESAVVTPDLLFKELDVVRSTAGRFGRPLVPPPVAAKPGAK
jgi:TldD protein